MSVFALKIKTKTDQQVLKDLTSETTIKDLKSTLSKLSEIPIQRLHILSGFPPKSLDLSVDTERLGESGISSGDTLILEEKAESTEECLFKTPSNQQMDNSSQTQSKTSIQNVRHHILDNDIECPGILMKHVVPADNSCLFTSIHYVLNGKDDTGGVASWMREIIAETISKDPEEYNEAILGKPNPDYCKWIKDDKSWGGAIELSILSNYYGIEIAVVDTINAIINRFGEDQDFPHRVFLLFDGIHYDPLFLEPLEGGAIRTIFPTTDDRILKEAEQLAKEAKSSRQFTDVNNFTLKCMVCSVHLSGQVQAQQHAQQTGHMNFGEI